MPGKGPKRPEHNKFVPLAIIGIGCLFPKADNLSEFWANIREGVDGVTDVPATHWRPEDYYDPDPKARDKVYAARGGFLSAVDFNPLEFGIPPRDLEAIDTTQLLGLIAAREALKDSGYPAGGPYDHGRTSVILGVTGALEMVVSLGARLGHPVWRRALKEAGVDDDASAEVIQRISGSYVEWQENSFPGLLGNVAAGRIANRFNLGGTNCVVDAACASSLSAVHMAALELASGRSDLAVTGGIDTFSDPFMYSCFSKTPALSPTGDSRPFDAKADGTILGEGVGLMVIKRLADAEADGDRIYAVIRGIGSSSDGKGTAVYTPNPAGQARALRQAYEQADISPATVEMLEAHGTGTKVGDEVEIAALREVYGPVASAGPWCALGTVKSQIGHTKAAAGAAGLIKTALALRRHVLPPTIKVTQPSPALGGSASPFYVNTGKRPWLSKKDHPRRAGVSAFGFGGSNFHVVLEEYPDSPPEIGWDGRVEIVALSAADPASLRMKLTDLDRTASWPEIRRFGERSRAAFDPRAHHRLTLVIEKDAAHLSELVKRALERLEAGPESKSVMDGIFYGVGPQTGRLAVMFPGQGAQYVNMGRDLACVFPAMSGAMEEANEAFEKYAGWSGKRLSDIVYPIPAFDDAARKANELTLRDTRAAQPAIGAVSLGMYRLLQSFGLKPDMAAGHSYGELPALCAAGRLEAPELLRLSILRGQLMADNNGHRGAMLAVKAPADETLERIAAQRFDLVVANKNSPTQTVLSGAAEEIERAAEFLTGQSVRNLKLNVSTAFHSPWMNHALPPFRAALAEVTLSKAVLPVYANRSADVYPDDPEDARELLAGQLTNPVEFVRQIENMHAAGARIFLEAGPNRNLTGLIPDILAGRPHAAIAVDASAGRKSGVADLASALAQLAALGVAVDLTAWYPLQADEIILEPAKPEFKMPVCGANQFTPKPIQKRQVPRMTAEVTYAPNPAPSREIQAAPASAKSVEMTLPGSGLLTEALNLTQRNMAVLQEMQTHTAELHSRFLAGQEAAHQSIQALIRQQEQILEKMLGLPHLERTPVEQPVLAPAVQPGPACQPPVAAAAPVGPVSQPAPQVAAALPEADRLSSVLLEVVSEQTGYPKEMLNLDMHLDADLGIDSIKRVEIFSALSGRLPGAPQAGPEDIGRLGTLRQVVEFLTVPEPVPASGQPLPAAHADAPGQVETVLLEVVSEQTGYPKEMLNLDMHLDADLGIDSIKRVEIFSALSGRLPGAPSAGPEDIGRLGTLRQVVEFLSGGLPAEPAPAPAASLDRAAELLIQVVAEQTGYPAEMLNLDMNLDTDLGVDSIKRVEILSVMAQRLPQAPSAGPEELSRLRTLREVAEFLSGGTPAKALSDDPAGLGTEASETSKMDERDELVRALFQAVGDRTGLPAESLRLDMNLSGDLGLDIIGLAGVAADLPQYFPGAPFVSPESFIGLSTLREAAEAIREQMARQGGGTSPAECGCDAPLRYVLRPSPLDAAEDRPAVRLGENARFWVVDDGQDLSRQVADELNRRGCESELIRPETCADLAPPADLEGLILMAPTEKNNLDALQASFELLRKTGEALRKAGRNGGSVLVTVSRMDGAFGLDGFADGDPVSGGLAGLLKTAGREWPEVQTKALDLDPSLADPVRAAAMIVDETLLAGPREVGLTADQRIGLRLCPEPVTAGGPKPVIEAGDVVVVSGGARGVTAEAALAMARAWRPTLVLLGRSPTPEPEPDWLKPLTAEADIKRTILDRAAKKLSPKALEKQYREAMANREIIDNIDRMKVAGANVLYRPVDIRDEEAVLAVLDDVREEYGPLRGLVHGAGILADRRIEDKTPEQFRDVMATKVLGLKALLSAAAGDDLKFMVLFSSSTGRFGRIGQIDYAAANEVLNKVAQQQSRKRPECRIVSVNWGPWEGGMVTPALKEIFREEGIDVIPMEAGAEYLIRELGCGDRRAVEIVVLGPGSDPRRFEEVIAVAPLTAAAHLEHPRH